MYKSENEKIFKGMTQNICESPIPRVYIFIAVWKLLGKA